MSGDDTPRVDPVALRIHQNLLDSVAEEMGTALERTGFSPNIKERRDFSCAIFDARGAMVAQAAHIPVHLGAMPLSVEAALAAHDFAPGDAVLLNDPWRGGTHLPDLTLVSGFFEEGFTTPTFFLAARAHHADVGGAARGSMALFTDIHQEGLRIPPVLWLRGGEVVRETHELLLANMRQPDEREGDLSAQRNALRVGEAGLARLLQERGRDEVLAYASHLQDAAERHVRALLSSIPDGTSRAVERLDGDGIDPAPLELHLALTIEGDAATFDFTGTAPQCAGPLNANRAITLSAVFYALRVLAGEEIPANSGCLRPVEVTIPPGSLLDPEVPAAVAGGNVETSQRLVDLCFAAFAPLLPGRVPAQSQGTMNNCTLGGRHPTPFSYYETIGGGAGAGPEAPGLSGHHSHMTNTRNTPVEALERTLPVRVESYTLREGSGGDGLRPGGEGVVRILTALSDLDAALLTERRDHAPAGAEGGGPGHKGENRKRTGDGREVPLPGKWSGSLAAGESLIIETPGGGGHGEARAETGASEQEG
jgi:N-methylhydantoinase B